MSFYLIAFDKWNLMFVCCIHDMYWKAENWRALKSHNARQLVIDHLEASNWFSYMSCNIDSNFCIWMVAK
jgi:hypothetical protein